MTVGVSDGERLYAARYASGPVANTLFVQRGRRRRCARSTPTPSASRTFSDDARVVVSEPLADLPGLWDEIPAGSAVVVGKDGVERVTVRPQRS